MIVDLRKSKRARWLGKVVAYTHALPEKGNRTRCGRLQSRVADTTMKGKWVTCPVCLLALTKGRN